MFNARAVPSFCGGIRGKTSKPAKVPKNDTKGFSILFFLNFFAPFAPSRFRLFRNIAAETHKYPETAGAAFSSSRFAF